MRQVAFFEVVVSGARHLTENHQQITKFHISPGAIFQYQVIVSRQSFVCIKSTAVSRYAVITELFSLAAQVLTSVSREEQYDIETEINEKQSRN